MPKAVGASSGSSIGPPLKPGRTRDQRRHLQDQRQGHDVNVKPALFGGLAQEREVLGMRRAFLGGGHAGAGVDLLGLVEGVEQFLLRRLRHVAEDRQESRLHDKAGRLVGALLAQDHAARRRLGVRIDADRREGGRVEHGAMVGAVDQHDRVVGEVGIELVAGQFAAFGQVGAVVAIADDPLALLDPELLDVLLEHGDEVGDLGDRGRRAARTRWPT